MECDFTPEEFRALVFFITVWRCIGDGDELADLATDILTPDMLDSVPREIIEDIGNRLHDSEAGVTNHEWIERALSGYRATLENMLELRGLANVNGDAPETSAEPN